MKYAILIATFLTLPAWADVDLGTIQSRFTQAQSDILAIRKNDDLFTTAKQLENLMSELREIERVTQIERNNAEEALFDRSGDFTKMVEAIITLENAPAPRFLVHPEGEDASIYASILIQGTTEALKAKSADIAAEVQSWREFAKLEANISETLSTQLDTLRDLQTEILRQGSLAELRENPVKDPLSLDRLYAMTNDFDEFAKGLARLPVETETNRNFEALRGNLDYPVRGEISDYPWRDGNGLTRPGIGIKTIPGSLVLAPTTTTVRFVGEFPDYGQVVFLEPAQGYMMIIANIEDIAVQEGDVLPASHPIGRAPQGDGENATVYLEVRKNGEKVDPRTYF